jgi:hypothetical protein
MSFVAQYEWKNIKTGKRELTYSPTTAPDESGEWKRVYSVAIGSVPGAGGSPSRKAN